MSHLSNTGPLVDAYGTLKAQLAELEAAKKRLEEALGSLPSGSYEGEVHRLTISDRLSTAPDAELKEQEKAVAEAAIEAYRETLSRQYITAHTVSKNIRTHRVVARTGKALAA
jgi:hypothetical protein